MNSDIDNFLLTLNDSLESRQVSRHVNHLSPTLISDECLRRSAYKFRWALPPEHFSGKKLRIFEIGKKIESIVIDWLENMPGLEFIHDPRSDEQYSITGLEGHFKGYADGLIRYNGFDYILEIKSMNTVSYNVLSSNGLKSSQGSHYTQIQSYMHFSDIKRCLYLCINKNNQDVYLEFVDYDSSFCEDLETSLYSILSGGVSFDVVKPYQCKKFGGCPYTFICKNFGMIDVNCRTCLYLEPTDTGDWLCTKHCNHRSFDEQKVSCDDYERRAF